MLLWGERRKGERRERIKERGGKELKRERGGKVRTTKIGGEC